MIFIAGGCGYIGSHANKELNRKGYETVLFDNLSRGHRELARWGRVVTGDLADTDQIRKVFKTYPISAVMHFSALAYVGESVEDPQSYYHNNVANTLNLLRVMLENDVNNFVFSSTCATYGLPREIPITEEHSREPINPYGRTKLMVENILEDYDLAYGLKSVSLRYFNAAGADPDGEIGEWHEPETHLIPLVLDVASGVREDLKIFGTDYPTEDGTCIRDYIHVTDLAGAHILALEYLSGNNGSAAFNLGNGRGFSVKEVIETAAEVTGTRIKTVDWQRRPGDPPVLIGDYSKAQQVLNWQPRYHELRTIIGTAWNWHRKLLKLKEH